MAKTIFEQMGGTYTMQGDYCLPDLTLPPEEERPIGVWGQRRLCYLKQQRKILQASFSSCGCGGRSIIPLSSADRRVRRKGRSRQTA